MSTLLKILASLAVLAGACFATAHFIEAGATQKVAAATKDRDDALAKVKALTKERDDAKASARTSEARADQWQGQANDAMNKVAALEQDLQTARVKLAGLRPQPGRTDPAKIPADQGNLAASYATAGFKPFLIQDGSLGFPLNEARPMLAVIQDGLQYPLALERIEDLTGVSAIQAAQVVQLKAAVEDKTQEALAQAQATAQMTAAEKDCEAQVTLLQGAVADDKTIIRGQAVELKSEIVKKWTWGGVGVVAGWLIRTVVFHWPF